MSRRAHARGEHPLHPLPPVGRTFLAGFESTYHPAAGVDALDLTGHADMWPEDLDQLLDAGVRHLRYPLRWQLIEAEPGVFDWSETDRVLESLRDRGAVPIVDLVHHTSYPDWLRGGFLDPRFGSAFVRYARAVAERYPWLPAYTLFNEPFATLFLAGHEALWPPYERGISGFRRLLLSVLPALSEVAGYWRAALPDALHVWVDTAENHTGVGVGVPYAEMANDRRHTVLDLLTGHDVDAGRPFLGRLLADGGEPLAGLRPLTVDVLGLDYYPHSEWFYDDRTSHAPSPHPVGLAAIAEHYWQRYGLPMMVTETNVRGLASDRTSWLRYTLEEYELALSRGVPLHGYCWFPQVDSTDWDSLLARCVGRTDPVGVMSLGQDGFRHRTSFTDAWEAAAAGLPVDELPATRFQAPCDAQLAGFLPSLAHWPWQDAPEHELVPALRADLSDGPTPTPGLPALHDQQPTLRTLEEHTMIGVSNEPAQPDLVVLSHLRWPWVWQRPQHLVSRFARHRATGGARTWFVEEPMVGDVDRPELKMEVTDGLTRVWLVVPEVLSPVARGEGIGDRGFEDAGTDDYGRLLSEMLSRRPGSPDVWVYTPMALDIANQLSPRRLIYDVMDDLASFKDAPPGLLHGQRRLFAQADVVFTGGPSLHRSVLRQRQHDVHLFRSGVETGHYRASRALRTRHDRRVAGYVGVIDERLDLDLIRGMAEALPDWTLRIVGPTAKIDPGTLPVAPNIEYPGMASYEDLPVVMAGFDVALMPFALNEATRSISPTKTLEYLAAGLPVVSTRVADVVADYSQVVHLADDGPGFAAACRKVILDDPRVRDMRARPLQAVQEWDYIAAEMSRLLDETAGLSALRQAEETA
jgi:hypothetical protein